MTIYVTHESHLRGSNLQFWLNIGVFPPDEALKSPLDFPVIRFPQ